MKRLYLTAILVSLAACNGFIMDGPSDPSLTDPPVTNPEPMTPPTCDGVCVGESPLTRIRQAEYLGLVALAFDADVDLASDALPDDGRIGRFRTNVGATLAPNDTKQFQDAADALASNLRPLVLERLTCDPAVDASECGREIFETYAPTLYRRTVEPEEAEPFAELFAWAHEEDDLNVAVELVLTTLLQSPYFLYRPEVVPDGGAAPLSGEAIAARLASLLWEGVPDAWLRDLAASGGLDDADGVEAAARQMLTDPRARENIGRFHTEWLGIEELRKVDDAMADSMRRETEGFAARIIQGDEPTVRELFTSAYAPIDSALAEHYETTEGEWVVVPGRRGILTHGSVLTAHGRVGRTRAIHRGVFILADVLCRGAAPAPDDVVALIEDPSYEPPSGDLTDREKVEIETAGNACSYCHVNINPPGFAFENFDDVGRFRTHDEEGRELTSWGELSGAGDADGSFDTHEDFVDQLAGSDTVLSCMAHQWFRFAMGRAETEADEVTLYEASQALQETGGNIPALIVSLVRSDAFRYRNAPSE